MAKSAKDTAAALGVSASYLARLKKRLPDDLQPVSEGRRLMYSPAAFKALQTMIAGPDDLGERSTPQTALAEQLRAEIERQQGEIARLHTALNNAQQLASQAQQLQAASEIRLRAIQGGSGDDVPTDADEPQTPPDDPKKAADEPERLSLAERLRILFGGHV